MSSTNSTAAAVDGATSSTDTKPTINKSTERVSIKLTKRLSVLPHTASKESIRTLSRWILFHIRHHSKSLLHTLKQCLTHMNKIKIEGTGTGGSGSSSSNNDNVHPLVCWNIIHDICTSYSSRDATGPSAANEEKWNGLHTFRTQMAETVIKPSLEHAIMTLHNILSGNSSNNNDFIRKEELIMVREKLQNMVSIWMELNCFDSITLADEMKRMVLKLVKEDGSGDGIGKSKTSSVAVSVSDDTNVAAAAATVAPVKEETTAEKKKETEQEITPTDATTTTVTVKEEINADVNNAPDDEGPDFDMGDADGGDTEDKNTDATPPIETPVDIAATTSPKVKEEGDTDQVMAENDVSVSAPVPAPAVVAEPKEDNVETAKDAVIPGASDADSEPRSTKVKEEEKKKPVVVKEFDFESQGIPKGKVEVHELNDPCTSIATMQITRDLRNDSSYNLSSLLSKVPTGIFEKCQKAKEESNDNNTVIDTQALLKDFGSTGAAIPDNVLDLDIATALSNVKLHREIIKKQKEYRRQCIELLIKSRCEFGSREAAELFYTLDGITDTLKKRKALILDAMELEGLDFVEPMEEDGDGDKEDDQDQREFTWLSRESAESNAKKQRTE